MPEITVSQIVEATGIPKQTLYSRFGKVPLPYRTDARGQRWFPEGTVEVVQEIEALRKQGMALDRIQEKLMPKIRALGGITTDEEIAVAEAVKQAIQEQTEQAKMYGAAMKEVGRLTGIIEEKDKQLAERQGLLEEKENMTQVINDMGSLIVRQQEEILRLKEQLNRKPWWKLWT